MKNRIPVEEQRRQWNVYIKGNVIDEYIDQCESMSISPHRRIEKFILSDIKVLKELQKKMAGIEHKIRW